MAYKTLADALGINHDEVARRTGKDRSSITNSMRLLQLSANVVGMIAIFKLLPQKPQLDAADRELFALLSKHAPLAMHYAGLRAAYANVV